MNSPRVTILRKGLLVLALPLIYQALFIGLLMKRQYDHNGAQAWAIHTKDVLTQTDRVYRAMVLSQSNMRAYVLTKNEMFAEALTRGERDIEAELGRLRSMVQDNLKQSERFERVATRVQTRLDYEHFIVQLLKGGEFARVENEVRELTGQPSMDALSKEIESFRKTEERLDAERISALRKSNVTQNWLLLGGLLVNVGIGAVAAILFSREISDRIKVVTENTQRIAEGQALPALVPGSDEIRTLDEQFHLLADSLKSARLRERVYQEALERRATELTRANRDLGQKNQEIEMFVYSVSHDLRSPLVNLQGFGRELSLAREELEKLLRENASRQDRERARQVVNQDITESVRYIQTAVARLSSIIDALLRLSRAGRIEYHPRQVEMKPVVHRIIEAMRATIVQRGAEVAVNELPPVWADPTAVEQIFANLIVNAVHYLDPKRPGRIEIGSTDRQIEGIEKALTYYVKDNGLGIAEAYLPKVFAIFQRLHGNIAVGEGVGLALVRRVVERHGGQVWVESVEGQGSTFFVAFPAAPQFSPLPVLAPRKERINLPAPSRHDLASSHHSAR